MEHKPIRIIAMCFVLLEIRYNFSAINQLDNVTNFLSCIASKFDLSKFRNLYAILLVIQLLLNLEQMNNTIINNKGPDYFANISSLLDFMKVNIDQCMIGKLYKFNEIIYNLEKENDVIQHLTMLYKYCQCIHLIHDRDKEACKDYASLVQ